MDSLSFAEYMDEYWGDDEDMVQDEYYDFVADVLGCTKEQMRWVMVREEPENETDAGEDGWDEEGWNLLAFFTEEELKHVKIEHLFGDGEHYDHLTGEQYSQAPEYQRNSHIGRLERGWGLKITLADGRVFVGDQSASPWSFWTFDRAVED